MYLMLAFSYSKTDGANSSPDADPSQTNTVFYCESISLEQTSNFSIKMPTLIQKKRKFSEKDHKLVYIFYSCHVVSGLETIFFSPDGVHLQIMIIIQ